jgi:uncharacterized protein (DUF1778 family)
MRGTAKKAEKRAMASTHTRTGPTRAPKAARKSERLPTRATPELKSLAQHAAALEGRSLTDFVEASIRERAERTIREHEVTRVSVEQARAFAQALLTPPEPSARLREAAAFFDAVIEDR